MMTLTKELIQLVGSLLLRDDYSLQHNLLYVNSRMDKQVEGLERLNDIYV